MVASMRNDPIQSRERRRNAIDSRAGHHLPNVYRANLRSVYCATLREDWRQQTLERGRARTDFSTMGGGGVGPRMKQTAAMVMAPNGKLTAAHRVSIGSVNLLAKGGRLTPEAKTPGDRIGEGSTEKRTNDGGDSKDGSKKTQELRSLLQASNLRTATSISSRRDSQVEEERT